MTLHRLPSLPRAAMPPEARETLDAMTTDLLIALAREQAWADHLAAMTPRKQP
ncbi:hypothetical protein [Gemmobacter denitrificans]|uniref:Uncharacterized protein n=1 Tax=Gemmobacter denitrificans TaxID=3123040 RepID=A0ABU8BUT7_9RHOB